MENFWHYILDNKHATTSASRRLPATNQNWLADTVDAIGLHTEPYSTVREFTGGRTPNRKGAL